MKKRLKDKKIIIYRAETRTDTGGFMHPAIFTPIHPRKLWAYVRQLSAKEFYASQALQIAEDMIFTINWRADLSTAETTRDLYVRYREDWYDVQRVDTFEGYKDDLKLHCKLTHTPDADGVREYPQGG